MFGLIGLLAKINRSGIEVDLDRSLVSSISRAQYSRNTNVMSVKLKDGQEFKSLLKSDYSEWEKCL